MKRTYYEMAISYFQLIFIKLSRIAYENILWFSMKTIELREIEIPGVGIEVILGIT
jgi:argininosuccinate lyase